MREQIITRPGNKGSYIQTQKEFETIEEKLKFKVIPSEDILKNYVPKIDTNRFESAVVKESNFAVLKYILSHLDMRRISKILLTYSHDSYLKDNYRRLKLLAKSNNVRAIVDFKKVNYTRHVNKYFESINSILPHTGIYIGCVESNLERNKRLYREKKKIIARIFIIAEFLFHRVLPRLRFFNGLYFAITKGRYRFLSTAETLGRLVSCGFEIIEFKEIRNLTYFVVIKTGVPDYDRNPSYGPIIKVKRTGAGRRLIKYKYKLRLRHPYSEYLNDYVLKLNGSSTIAAATEDIRLTKFGKVLQESWLANIPQRITFINNKVRQIYSEEFVKIKLFPKLELDDIFYIKHSLGKGGRPIRIYKLRTMKKGADKEDHNFNRFNSHGNPINDTRITAMGKFMRKVWIDEWPQLLNVIKGDIKIVGIRPMRESDWERYPADIKESALKQRPGIMGIQYGSACKGGIENQYKYFRDYLDKWGKSPFSTDFKYFFRIWYNIFFKGVRSD